MEENSLIVNKNIPLSDTASNVFNMMARVFGYSSRISDYWNALPRMLGIGKEFEVLDLKTIINGDFDSFLIDVQREYMNGEDVNFTAVKNRTIEIGDFTSRELLQLQEKFTDEVIWGIYHQICFKN